MGHCFGRCCQNFIKLFIGANDGEIISEKSLIAVEYLVALLKGYAHTDWMFRPTLYNRNSQDERIFEALRKGKTALLRKLVTINTSEDGVSGLQMFLENLGEPLVPGHIQALALENNPKVEPETIAADMLGLMRENLPERHLRLVTALLDLLNCRVKLTHTHELKGSAVPISMLPVFFHLQALHIPQWRKLINILMEMIRLAPGELNIPTTSVFRVPNVHFNRV